MLAKGWKRRGILSDSLKRFVSSREKKINELQTPFRFGNDACVERVLPVRDLEVYVGPDRRRGACKNQCNPSRSRLAFGEVDFRGQGRTMVG